MTRTRCVLRGMTVPIFNSFARSVVVRSLANPVPSSASVLGRPTGT